MKFSFLLTFLMGMMMLTQKVVSMGALLMAVAIMSTILISLTVNPWYGFILFLIYVTGLLVLFGYFLAMSPNTLTTTKKCFKSYLVMSVPLLLVGVKLLDLPLFKPNFEKSAFYLLSPSNLSTYWAMVLILLLIMVMVVTITFKTPKPLRHYV